MTEAAGWDCHVHIFDAAWPAAAGHYVPATRTLHEIESAAAHAEVGHLVLVQPSVYGTDNSLLLQALQQQPGRHRGVVVLDPAIPDLELDAMHAAGVRGARLNLVSPVGESADSLQQRFAALAPRLHERGWHLQWYAGAESLPAIAALHRGSGPVCVLDHLAGLRAGLGPAHAAWDALRRLAEEGAWVKLSGWYRLGAKEPYEALDDTIGAVHRLMPDRCVWGSDWPHTAFAADAMPAYHSTWLPVERALGQETARRLRLRQPPLYR